MNKKNNTFLKRKPIYSRLCGFKKQLCKDVSGCSGKKKKGVKIHVILVGVTMHRGEKKKGNKCVDRTGQEKRDDLKVI